MISKVHCFCRRRKIGTILEGELDRSEDQSKMFEIVAGGDDFRAQSFHSIYVREMSPAGKLCIRVHQYDVVEEERF